ncbi:FHIPEP family type III secretion protein [bacterium]|nr:FHIPEP family type III secretion protein [bacterium]
MHNNEIDRKVREKYAKIKSAKNHKHSTINNIKMFFLSAFFGNYYKIKNNNIARKIISNYEPRMSVVDKIKSLQSEINDISNEKNEINQKRKSNKEKELSNLQNPSNMYERLGVDVLAIFISENIISIADPTSNGSLIPNVASLREYLTDELGYIIPNVRILDYEKLPEYEYQIHVRNKKVFTGKLTKEELKNNNSDKIIENLGEVCIKYSKQVFSKTDTLKLMELVKSQDPTLVNDLVPHFISAIDLTIILSNLIHSGFPIKDVLFIFERLNNYAQYTQNTEILTNLLKQDLSF